MEPDPAHSQKSQLKAIFRDLNLQVLPPARRNIGIDYVVSDSRVKAWYGGVVTKQGRENGYGRRIHIQLDVAFEFQGRRYQVFQAYAHLQKILVSQGQTITQGQQIGVQGGSGSNGDNDYPIHVDLSTYVQMGGEIVQLNPQALDLQLASQQSA
jgi:hypothetical protein